MVKQGVYPSNSEIITEWEFMPILIICVSHLGLELREFFRVMPKVENFARLCTLAL